MWFAPLPVLLFALESSAWQAGFVAAVAWLVGCLNLWSYLRGLGAPPIAWIVQSGTGAIVFAAGVLLTRALARRGAVWSAWLALPAVCVTFEYARYLVWPHGSGTSVAYSQLNFLPFLQWASVTGPWGMSFVLMLFPAGLALGLYLWNGSRRQAMAVAGATIGVVTAVLIFGVVRLQISQPGPEVRVGLVASDADGNINVARPGAATERLFAEYAQRAQELIARGAQVVVLPENLGVVLDPDVARADALFQAVVDRTGATLVVGMTHAASQAMQHNEARIYSAEVAVRSYDKEHLLPPGESMYTPGVSRTLFKAHGRTMGQQLWGVAICKDFDFTEPARGYGKTGVGLMLAPAWDFRVDGFWHGHIAVMRAVEDGFSLVRAAKNGLLTVADARGRIVAETASNAAPFATLMANVRVGHDDTLFLLLGDWFGWCAIAVLVAVVAVTVWQPSRRSGTRQIVTATTKSGMFSHSATS
jgi:apolipoprotein N-acyltransferase